MLTAVLGLSAALSWGCADFLGGLASRSAAVLGVLVVSQTVALSLLALVVLAFGGSAPSADFVVPAMLAGLAEATALAAFYSGLSRGAMGVVAPVSAIAGVVPLAVGLASGDPVSALHIGGMVVALAGTVATGIDPSSLRVRRGAAAGAGLALVAAVSFGLFFVAIGVAAKRADPLWAVLVSRSTMVGLLLAAAAIARPALPRAPRRVAGLVVIGVLDIMGTTLYASATRHGLISIVGVLASAYPVITVILARVVIRERLHIVQRAGSVLALTGVVLINV